MPAIDWDSARRTISGDSRRVLSWSRKRRQRHGNTVLYVLGNCLRWLIIALLFVFLLAMVIVLSEVMAFQNRVVGLIGDDDRARSVVLMLHRIHENRDAYPDDETLPYAALAVRLDRILAAQRQLARFSDFASTADETAPAAASATAGTGAASNSVEPALEAAKAVLADEEVRVYREQSDLLASSVIDLHRILSDQEPQIIVIETLDEVERAIAGLSRFEIDAPVPTNQGRALDQAKETTGTEAAAAFAERVREVDLDLAALKQALRQDPLNVELTEQLEALTGSVESLYALRLRDGESFRRKAGEPSFGPKSANAPIGNEVLDQIADDAGQLDLRLASRFGKGYSAAREISQHINKMRDQAQTLGRFSPKAYASPLGDVVGGEQAQEAYTRVLGEMAETFQSLEKSLGDRTRITAIANVIRAGASEEVLDAGATADAIINDFDALDRFLWVMAPFTLFSSGGPGSVAGIDLHPQRLATLSTGSITTIYIFMIGAIGSLLYIAKYYIGMALQGHWLRHRPTRPLSWLIFRPLFGVVVAFAVYLVVRAGQLAFGAGGDEGFGTDLNIPIISVVALFAGLLSWQALGAIESRGSAWFGAHTRAPLWAGGLGNALRTADRSITELAHQIGRSVEQIERWLLFRDKVPVEMQDRITTWLERSVDELFSDRRPAEHLAGQPLWATGLKRALEDREHRLDVRGLAELLREDDVERIRKWINLKLQVTPPMQWRLVDALQVPHHRLFDRHIEDRQAWGFGLRAAMRARKLRANRLAEMIELADVGRLHEWKELDAFVPVRWQDDLVTALDTSHADLFEFEPPDDDTFLWAHGLAEAIEAAGKTVDGLAHEVDVEVERATAWIRRDRQLAPATRMAVANALGLSEEQQQQVFRSYREHLAGGPAADASGAA